MTVAATVVIPAFNTADTLGDTLDCLLRQTLPCWDAVIVDDGSSDATAAIAQSYCDRDPRFRLIRQANAGVSAARNTGLAAATGEWILFLDSDDWVSDDFFEKMMAAARRHKRAGAVYCGYNRVTPEGVRLPQDWEEDVAARPFHSFARGCPVVVHGIIVRRHLLLDVGGFDTELITCEDWDLWQKVARTGARFVGIPDTLAFYRLRAGSLSTATIQMLRDGLKVTARAWRADPRVAHPAPAFANGRNSDDTDGSPGYFLCWCAGEYAAQGHDCSVLFDSVEALPAIKDRTDQLAGAAFDGIVAVGQAGPAETLIEQWPILDARLGGFFEGLEKAVRRPGLAKRLREGLRAQMVYENNVAKATTLPVVMDIRRITGVDPGPDVDTVHLQFKLGKQELGDTQIPVWGSLGREDVAKALVETLHYRKLVKHGVVVRDPRFWTAFASEGVRSWKRIARAALRAPERKQSVKAALINVFTRAALEAAGVPGASQTSSVAQARQRIAAMGDTVRAEIAAPASPASTRKLTREDADPTRDPKEFFEKVFESEDPWDYTNNYETLKYQQTLAMLGDQPIGKAMEVACAEGHFTRMLAPKVDSLFAVDIAKTAVERAQARCADLTNISYGQFDLIEDSFPAGLDLIVCSEVLYYLEDREKLGKVAARMQDALAPGGRLLMAHAYQLSDDSKRTGFDWGDEYGGQTISEVFADTPGLQLEKALDTELYRINLFRRAAADAPAVTPVIEQGPIALPLDPEIERYVIWGGAVARRVDVEQEERTNHIPVLCYHRVASDGPADLADYRVTPEEFAEQMRLLRRYGYQSVTSADLISHAVSGRPFNGRPVMITFDDGYQDFADNAWPILRRNDFTAEMFIVTDKVGGESDWDAQYGPPAPLMSWDTIQALHKQGVVFGSHLATHRDAQALTPEELLREAAGSKALIEAKLGTTIESIAAPFGLYDDRLTYVLDLCGYKASFTTNDAVASIFSDLMSVPRLEIYGGTSLADFADNIGLELEDEAPRRRVTRLAAPPDDLVTVIVPAFNGAETIDETLSSVRAQTHAALEILVVDDGSTDATRQIALRHAAADNRVRLIEQANAGVAAARNHGLREARGRFIAPVDADDVWRSDKVRLQMEAMAKGGDAVGLVYTWFAVIDDAGRVMSRGRPGPIANGRALGRMAQVNLPGNGSTPLIRKAALDDVGGYDESLRARGVQGCEDLQLYLAIAERWEIACVPQFLTGYRLTRSTMSSDAMRMLASFDAVMGPFAARHPELAAECRQGRIGMLTWLHLRALRGPRWGMVSDILKTLYDYDRPAALNSLRHVPSDLIEMHLMLHLRHAARALRRGEARFVALPEAGATTLALAA